MVAGCQGRVPMRMARVAVDDLLPRAKAALIKSPISEVRDLRVDGCDGELLLSGTVTSFYHKQLAQEVVWAVCKNIEIELINRIEVVNQPDREL
jgi:osmotically-inducible protein OsmY